MPEFPKVLSGTALKLIACISMFIDHACDIMFPYSQSAFMVRLTVGRIAMPLYIFLLCEGFFNTHNRKKYAISMLITAIISEPIYDIAFYGTLFYPAEQNVCFILLCGLLMLCILDHISLHSNVILHIPVIAAFCIGSYFLNFSYDYTAILSIAVLYYLHWHHNSIQGLADCAVVSVFQNTPGAFLAAVPMCLYNGKRGTVNGKLKYFFYAFYPAHLLILYVISLLITTC